MTLNNLTFILADWSLAEAKRDRVGRRQNKQKATVKRLQKHATKNRIPLEHNIFVVESSWQFGIWSIRFFAIASSGASKGAPPRLGHTDSAPKNF